MPNPELLKRIYEDFGYHPATPKTGELHERTRRNFVELAEWLVYNLPEGRDLSLCLTALEDSCMRANKAIAMTAPLESRG
jgi:hypothetical protein